MALSTVIGSSGSGKSTYLYKRIIDQAISSPDRNFIIIVPEQYTMSTQRLLVAMHPNHCIMNIDVLSFNRLAYRVFEELGMSVLGVLDDTGKSLVLRKLVTEKQEELVALRKNMTRVSYIAQVKSLISEMTQYNITPDVLREMIGYDKMSTSFRMKAQDLLVMYEAFLDFIDGRYVTTESILSELDTVLDSSSIVCGSTIVFDGFTGFTPIQYQLVEHFLTICDEVLVSVTADDAEVLLQQKGDDELFAMSADFVQRLNFICKRAGVEICEPVYIDGSLGRVHDNEILAHLEKSIFRVGTRQYQGQKNASEVIELATLKNPRAELLYVAIEINKLIRTGQYSYKDFAVVCPNLEQYRYVVDGIWSDYSIPYFIDSKTEIIFHPFVEAIDAIFEMFDKDFTRESVFRFLRTGFCDIPIEDIDAFENYVLSTGIRGRKKYFHPFAIKSNSFYEEDSLVRINAIRERFIEPFVKFDRAMNDETTVSDIARALYELLVYFDCEKKIALRQEFHEQAGHQVKAKEYSQIYKVVMNLLDKMVSILDQEIMDLEDFADIFKAGLSAASIGVIPPAHDSVIIGDMERTRLDNIKILFLVGASDDAIPKKVENGGILSQLERELLLEKFEMAPSDRQKAFRQRFYLYLMLTKPKEKLVITSPRVDGAGKGVRTSYLMDVLCKMFDSVRVKNIEEFDFDSRLLSNRGAQAALIELIKKAKAVGINGLAVDERAALDVLFSWAKLDEKIDLEKIIETAFYSHVKEVVSEDVMLMINEAFNEDETVQGSVSKFETYAGCAYRYYLTYILKLREREEFELSSLDMGNIYHGALETYGRLLKELGIKWADVTDEIMSNNIDAAIKSTFEKMGKVATLEDPTQRYIVDSMRVTLNHTVSVLTEQVKRGTFEPEMFEEKIESVLTDFENGEIVAKLHGTVDRIDLTDGDDKAVRIIDYKSSMHKLDLDACYYGLSLQLPIYMGVVMDKLGELYKGAVHPSAMLYYSTQNPYIKGRIAESSLKEERLKMLKMEGLLADSEDDIFANDKTIFTGDSQESSVVPVKLKKDGTPDANSKTISAEAMTTVIDYAGAKATEIAKKIIAGEFECAPTVLGGRTPCEYCGFNSVCHFDVNIDGFEVNEVEKIGKDVIGEMNRVLGRKGESTHELDG